MPSSSCIGDAQNSTGKLAPSSRKNVSADLVAHAVAVQRDVERAVADIARGHAGERRMEQRMNLVADDVGDVAADHPRRGRIDECRFAVEIHAEHAFDRGVEDQLVLPAEARQLLRLPLDGLRLPEQLDEDVDLRSEGSPAGTA